MTATDGIDDLSQDVVAALANGGYSVATAESCTGGWIANALTDVPGSSQCFGYGVVSYSNDAKISLLGVRPEVLEAHGAVSEPVVAAMALGVARLSGADVGVSVSGIAGPDGGTPTKPVGTVWFAWSWRAGAPRTRLERFEGDRRTVRARAVVTALEGVLEEIASHG